MATYPSPGIYTESVRGPQVGIASGTPTSLGIVGNSVRNRTHTERITLDGTTAVRLTKTGVDQTTIRVRNSLTGLEYEATDDYVITDVEGDDPSGVDDVTQIARASSSDIPDGETVEVTYLFADAEYYQPHEFFDFDDVRDFYGEAFDGSGNVLSGITLAAMIAFTNGAGRITCVTPVHSGSGAPSIQAYSDALSKLEDRREISVIVSDSANESFLQTLANHCEIQSTKQRERRAVVGFDGSAVAVPSPQRQTVARSIKSRRVAAVSPDSVGIYVQSLNKEVRIGGQFLAVAVAATSLANPPVKPLTRNRILGFTTLGETMGEDAKSLETDAGLLVVENAIDGTLRVRHGVTTDPATTESREWSITSQQDALVYQIRSYLDAASLIGQPITDTTLSSVKGTVDAALQRLLTSGNILDYSNLKARQLNDPVDTVEIRFDWRPSMPMNYIVVRFSIDLSTGAIESI